MGRGKKYQPGAGGKSVAAEVDGVADREREDDSSGV